MTAAAGAGAAAAGGVANKIATAFIGIAPVIEEEEFQRVGETGSDYFAEGFVEGVKKATQGGVLRDPFLDAALGFAESGAAAGEAFLHEFGKIVSGSQKIDLNEVFKISEHIFDPIMETIDGLWDKTAGAIVSKIPIVGGAVDRMTGLIGGMYEPIKHFTLELAELGEQYQEIERRLASNSLDLGHVRELTQSVEDIFSLGSIVRPQDITNNIGLLESRLNGLTTAGLEEFTVKVSEANEILGNITIDPRKLTAALNSFGIEGDHELTGAMNRWTNIMRSTGAQMNQVLGQAINIGPSMRQLGYDGDQVIQMFAQMNEAGEPMQRLVWSFSGAVKRIDEQVAKGTFKNTEEGFKSIIDQAKVYIALGTQAGDNAATWNLEQWFGQRGAPVALEAIKKGLLELPTNIKPLDGINADIATAVDETKSLGEVFTSITLQFKNAFSPMGEALANVLADSAQGVSVWLRDHREKLVTFGLHITDFAIKSLGTFIEFGGRMVMAAAPFIELFSEYTTRFFAMMAERMQFLIFPMVKLSEAMGGLPIIGNAFEDFNKGLEAAKSGLKEIKDLDFNDILGGMGKAGVDFNKDLVPKILGAIDGGGKNLLEDLRLQSALSGPIGHDGAPMAAIDTTKAGRFLAEIPAHAGPDGQVHESPQETKERGEKTLAMWAEIKRKLGDEGIIIDYNPATGEITKLDASTQEQKKDFERLWNKLTEKSVNVPTTSPQEQLKAILEGKMPVEVDPHAPAAGHASWSESLFPDDAKPAAWNMDGDGLITIPAAMETDRGADVKSVSSILESMGIPSDMRGTDGIVVPVKYQLPAGGVPVVGVSSISGGGGVAMPGLAAPEANLHGVNPQIGLADQIAGAMGLHLSAGKDNHDPDGGWHPVGQAGDFSNDTGGWQKSFALDNTPQQEAFAQLMLSNFAPYIEELIYNTPSMPNLIAKGQVVNAVAAYGSADPLSGSTLSGHTDHVHLAIKDGMYQQFMAAVQAAMVGGGLPGGLPPAFNVGSRTDGGGGGGGGQNAALVAALRAQGFNESQITGLVALNGVETGDWAHPESIMGFTNQQVGPGIEAHVAGFKEMWDRRQRTGAVSMAGSSDSGMDAAGRVVDPTKFANWLLKLEGYSATKDWAGNTYAPGQFLAPESYAGKVAGAYGGGAPVVSRDVDLADYSTSLLNPYLSGSSLLDSQGGSSLFGGGAGGASSLFTPGAAGASPFGRIIDDAVRGGVQIPAAPSGGANGLVGLSLDSAGLDRVAAAEQELKADRSRAAKDKKDAENDAASDAFWNRPLGERVKDVGGLVSEASRMLDTLTSIETYLKAAGVDTESDGFSDKVRGFEAFPGAKTDARPDGEGYIPVLSEMNSLINQGLNKLAPRFGLDTSGTFRYEDLIESPIGDVVDQTKQAYGLVTGDDSTAGERAVGLFGLAAPVAAVAAPGVGAAVGRGAAAAGRAGINAVQNIPSSILNNAGPFVDAMTAMPDGTLFGQGLAMASAIPFVPRSVRGQIMSGQRGVGPGGGGEVLGTPEQQRVYDNLSMELEDHLRERGTYDQAEYEALRQEKLRELAVAENEMREQALERAKAAGDDPDRIKELQLGYDAFIRKQQLYLSEPQSRRASIFAEAPQPTLGTADINPNAFNQSEPLADVPMFGEVDTPEPVAEQLGLEVGVTADATAAAADRAPRGPKAGPVDDGQIGMGIGAQEATEGSGAMFDQVLTAGPDEPNLPPRGPTIPSAEEAAEKLAAKQAKEARDALRERDRQNNPDAPRRKTAADRRREKERAERTRAKDDERSAEINARVQAEFEAHAQRIDDVVADFGMEAGNDFGNDALARQYELAQEAARIGAGDLEFTLRTLKRLSDEAKARGDQFEIDNLKVVEDQFRSIGKSQISDVPADVPPIRSDDSIKAEFDDLQRQVNREGDRQRALPDGERDKSRMDALFGRMAPLRKELQRRQQEMQRVYDETFRETGDAEAAGRAQEELEKSFSEGKAPLDSPVSDATAAAAAEKTKSQLAIENILAETKNMDWIQLGEKSSFFGMTDDQYLKMLEDAAATPEGASGFMADFMDRMKKRDEANAPLTEEELAKQQADESAGLDSLSDGDGIQDRQMTPEERLTAEGYPRVPGNKGSVRYRATAYYEQIMREQQAFVEESGMPGAPKGRVLDELGQVGMWWNPKTFDEYMKSNYAKRASGRSPDIFWEMPEEDFAKYAAEEVVNATRNYGSTAAQRNPNYAVRDMRISKDDFLKNEFGLDPPNNRGGKKGRVGAAKQSMIDAARAAAADRLAERQAQKAAEQAVVEGGGTDSGVPKIDDIVPVDEPDLDPELQTFSDMLSKVVDSEFAPAFVKELQGSAEANGYYLSDLLQKPEFTQYVSDYLAYMQKQVEKKGLDGLPVDTKAGLTFSEELQAWVDANGIPIKRRIPGEKLPQKRIGKGEVIPPGYERVKGAFGTSRLQPIKDSSPAAGGGGGSDIPPDGPPPGGPPPSDDLPPIGGDDFEPEPDLGPPPVPPSLEEVLGDIMPSPEDGLSLAPNIRDAWANRDSSLIGDPELLAKIKEAFGDGQLPKPELYVAPRRSARPASPDFTPDSLLDQARKLVVSEQLASQGFVQRKLNVGWERAGELMNQLEAQGVIGPKPEAGGRRDVLMKPEDIAGEPSIGIPDPSTLNVDDGVSAQLRNGQSGLGWTDEMWKAFDDWAAGETGKRKAAADAKARSEAISDAYKGLTPAESAKLATDLQDPTHPLNNVEAPAAVSDLSEAAKRRNGESGLNWNDDMWSAFDQWAAGETAKQTADAAARAAGFLPPEPRLAEILGGKPEDLRKGYENKIRDFIQDAPTGAPVSRLSIQKKLNSSKATADEIFDALEKSGAIKVEKGRSTGDLTFEQTPEGIQGELDRLFGRAAREPDPLVEVPGDSFEGMPDDPGTLNDVPPKPGFDSAAANAAAEALRDRYKGLSPEEAAKLAQEFLGGAAPAAPRETVNPFPRPTTEELRAQSAESAGGAFTGRPKLERDSYRNPSNWFTWESERGAGLRGGKWDDKLQDFVGADAGFGAQSPFDANSTEFIPGGSGGGGEPPGGGKPPGSGSADAPDPDGPDGPKISKDLGSVQMPDGSILYRQPDGSWADELGRSMDYDAAAEAGGQFGAWPRNDPGASWTGADGSQYIEGEVLDSFKVPIKSQIFKDFLRENKLKLGLAGVIGAAGVGGSLIATAGQVPLEVAPPLAPVGSDGGAGDPPKLPPIDMLPSLPSNEGSDHGAAGDPPAADGTGGVGGPIPDGKHEGSGVLPGPGVATAPGSVPVPGGLPAPGDAAAAMIPGSGGVPGAPGSGSGYVPGAPGSPGLAQPGGPMPQPASTPYGDTTVYDPYNNLPPWPLTPEEFQKWKHDWDARVLRDQQRNQKLGDFDGRIDEAEARRDDAVREYVAAKAITDGMYKTAEEAAIKAGTDPAAQRKALESNVEFQSLLKDVDRKKTAADNAQKGVDKLEQDKGDAEQQARIDAEDPYPKAPGKDKKKDWKSDKDAEALGHGLVKGMLEEFGFDGSLFSNPLDWGITKFLTGGANYGLGLLKNMNPAGPGQGGPYPGDSGPGNIPGSIVTGAAGEAGISGIASLFQPSKASRPGAVMPSDPSSVTAATSPSQDPGVAPAGYSGGDTNFNITNNGVPITQAVNQAWHQDVLPASRVDAFTSGPGGIQ